jgi:hypothetical protein
MFDTAADLFVKADPSVRTEKSVLKFHKPRP